MPHDSLLEKVKRAHQAKQDAKVVSEDKRIEALLRFGDLLSREKKSILEANEKDRQASAGQNPAFLDRLTLTEKRLQSLSESVQKVAKSPQVVGTLLEERVLSNGLRLMKETVPLGLVGFIFESRPNVFVDAVALGIKSGNSMVLRAGKESLFTVRAFETLVRQLTPFYPTESIQVLSEGKRQEVKDLVELEDFLDLIVPRGGPELVRFVKTHTRVPVIAHDKGLCHLYVHMDADPTVVLNVTENAKVSRPGVCNAVETLLLHEAYGDTHIERLFHYLHEKKVLLKVDRVGLERFHGRCPFLVGANDDDWSTEYLDLILNVKLVKGVEEAVRHIAEFGTKHTEAILAKDPSVIRFFRQNVDAASLMVNTSTRFHDGGELGYGTELGISTSKIHVYGPMGACHLVATRHVVEGEGQVRPLI